MKIKINKNILWAFLMMAIYSCQDQKTNAQSKLDEEKKLNEIAKLKWVDSMYNHMSMEEKIGQMFMVNAYSGGPNRNDTLIESLIKNNAIGGIIFMQGTAESQALLTHRYHSLSKIPLLIGMDAEWGLGMRLTGVENLPRQMMLGATKDAQLVYELGEIVAEQCKRLGVHFNFAPVVDINNNPKNPVINFRSFGQDKNLVSKLGIAYMKGMQDNGILASAKHFPGHGDVDVDSHLDLPIIGKPIEELQSMELYPFQQLIDSGIASVMVAHLSVPSLDSNKNTPTTLSYSTITELLKNKMKFDGLIITDALNMEGVTKYYDEGEVELKAFKAGNDILLFSKNVPLGIQKIKDAILSGEIKEERLTHSVKKILMNKYELGLNKTQELIDTMQLTVKINERIPTFNLKAARAGLTFINSTDKTDLKLPNNEKINFLSVNGSDIKFEQDAKAVLKDLKVLKTNDNISKEEWLIISIHNINLYPGKDNNYGISARNQELLRKYKDREKTIFVFFGNPYAAKFLPNSENIFITYEENDFTKQAVIDFFNGSLKAKGILPVDIK